MTGYSPPASGTPAWDGPLNDIIAEIDADMQDRALDADVMHDTGEETVAGIKHFSSGITVPNASLPQSAIDGLEAALSAVEGVAGDAVVSVNGQAGTVVLDAADIGALADDATFDDITDGTTNVAFTTGNKSKLNGIANGATANSSDATLKARANHTGTQAASTISDFAEAAQDAVAAALVAGSGVTISYNDGANTITISASGGGGGGALYPRDTETKTTASLATNAYETGVIALGPSYSLSKVEVDRPARVRLYASTAQRDADVARSTSTVPTNNHGVIADIVVPAAGYLDITPAIPGVTVGGGNAPITITNLDASTGTVTVTLTFQRTED